MPGIKERNCVPFKVPKKQEEKDPSLHWRGGGHGSKSSGVCIRVVLDLFLSLCLPQYISNLSTFIIFMRNRNQLCGDLKSSW